MKTKTILFAGLIAMLLTCHNLQAQFSYGVHAGMNLETQAQLGNLWNNCEVYQGFLIGGFLEYKTGRTISLQTELNYQKKGEKIKSTQQGIESVSRRELNYISVPLLVKSTFHDAGLRENCDLTFLAGPYLGYLTSANARLKTGDTTSPIDIDKQVEKTDMGAIIGGGVLFKLADGGAILAEFRYQMGLTTIDKQDKDLRNKGFGLTIGYRF